MSGTSLYRQHGCLEADPALQARNQVEAEVKSLLGLVERGVDTAASVRAVIAVPPRVRTALEAYVRTPGPRDGKWMVRSSLAFRDRMLRRFDELVAGRAS
jgi:hypothetical protein